MEKESRESQVKVTQVAKSLGLAFVLLSSVTSALGTLRRRNLHNILHAE